MTAEKLRICWLASLSKIRKFEKKNSCIYFVHINKEHVHILNKMDFTGDKITLLFMVTDKIFPLVTL